jgi:uncharacterized membrane protein SpoIIM required for sporulation
MADGFIAKRKLDWQKLEALLDQSQELRGLRKLARDEVRELGRSYRRTATDLAVARVESRDARLVSYLNNLVIRGHGVIYRTKSASFSTIWHFYWNLFPAIFRTTFRFTLSIFLIFVAVATFSFIATWRNDDFAEFAYLNSQAVQHVKEGHKWWERLNDEAPVGAAALMANNIGVALRTFALSILPIIGTVQALLPTSLQFGAINALAIKYGMKLQLWSFVAGHGVLEFSAIFIAGGAGLKIGYALLIPGDRNRLEALYTEGTVSIQLLAGCFPLLILAGMIESFLSPASFHWGYKIGVSIITALGLVIYLLKGTLTQINSELRKLD